jgi:hypothetical protein
MFEIVSDAPEVELTPRLPVTVAVNGLTASGPVGAGKPTDAVTLTPVPFVSEKDVVVPVVLPWE